MMHPYRLHDHDCMMMHPYRLHDAKSLYLSVELARSHTQLEPAAHDLCHVSA
jgi:hypothetical protein